MKVDRKSAGTLLVGLAVTVGMYLRGWFAIHADWAFLFQLALQVLNAVTPPTVPAIAPPPPAEKEKENVPILPAIVP